MAVPHRAMRDLIVDLLTRQNRRWTVAAVDGISPLGDALISHADVVVMDAAGFPGRCRGRCVSLAPARVVVIGPEPDATYRQTTLDQGAAAWITREDVGDELSSAICVALGHPIVRAPPQTPSRQPPDSPVKEDAR